MTTIDHITRARHHIDTALSYGWTCESMVCDHALTAMEMEGHDADLAADAVQEVWQQLKGLDR